MRAVSASLASLSYQQRVGAERESAAGHACRNRRWQRPRSSRDNEMTPAAPGALTPTDPPPSYSPRSSRDPFPGPGSGLPDPHPAQPIVLEG
jgi:hypothetical protein